MAAEQTEFTEAELLADHDIVEPLMADGVLCHGGFDDQGEYVYPRTNTAGRPSTPGRSNGSPNSARRSSTSRSTPGPRISPTSNSRSS